MTTRTRPGMKGAPLALFVIVLAGWVSARAMVWDSAPMPAPTSRLPALPAAVPDRPSAPQAGDVLLAAAPADAMLVAEAARAANPPGALATSLQHGGGPALLLRDAPPSSPPISRPATRPGVSPLRPDLSPLPPAAPASSPAPAPAPAPASSSARRAERWSLDAWGFFRQGSDTAPISQGRVPIYGASQIGAIR